MGGWGPDLMTQHSVGRNVPVPEALLEVAIPDLSDRLLYVEPGQHLHQYGPALRFLHWARQVFMQVSCSVRKAGVRQHALHRKSSCFRPGYLHASQLLTGRDCPVWAALLFCVAVLALL